METAILASAKALSDFPSTRNVDAVLSFFAERFTGVDNGLETDIESQRELLLDLEDQIRMGVPVRISLRASAIRVHLAGPFAWATYDYGFRVGAGSESGDEEQGKCSSVLVKRKSSWLLLHEHCSSLCPGEEEEEPIEEEADEDRA